MWRPPTANEQKVANNINFDYASHPKYNIDPFEDIKNQGCYELKDDEPVQAGDRILYGQDADQNGTLNPVNQAKAISEAQHAGIVTQVDGQGNATEVWSKFGDNNLTSHHPLDLTNQHYVNIPAGIHKYYRKRQ